jgi:methionyl-tRNA formyltransferase
VVSAGEPLRIVFFGTPAFAVPTLQRLLDSAHPVVAVVTQPDRPRGRGQRVSDSPVKSLAQTRALPILQPTRLRDPLFAEALRGLNPDLGVVAAYGKLIPEETLVVPRHGMINVHASLLPRWRGAAPIQWAIAAGDGRTGISLMKMDEGLDTGPVFSRAEIEIRPDETSETLHERLSVLGADLLRRDLPAFVAGELKPVPQPAEGVTLAPMIEKEDGLLDFARSAVELERRVRAFTPWPGAFVHLRHEDAAMLLKVHRARVDDAKTSARPGTIVSTSGGEIAVATGMGVLALREVQPEGRRRMTAAEFLAGHPLQVGTVPFVRERRG